MFAVNPLGVQADGALVEGTTSQGQAFGGLTSGRESSDLSPDFVFQSRGRLTDAGFEIEVRIPFKSLRYQSADPQDWGFNVTRVLSGEGREDSWAPARRDEASFLGQSGSLSGLTDLRRGLVLDLNPFVTARADGREVDRAWQYDTETPDVGINVRWGVTSTLTLNGTVHPDFSQVESDAGQFQFDPRQALYYPEKRPFFLDAIEQFATPNRLIYTRRIVAPEGAVKLTGKVTPTSSVAVLSAVDDQSFSRTREDHPVFTIVRLQQDVGRQSKLGVVYTDRVAGEDSNRVAGVDTRLVLGEIYALQAQGAVSRTDVAGTITTAPLWEVAATRTGRRYGFRYSARGVDDQFRAAAGFIERAGIATIQLTNQAIFPGGPTARLERFTSDVALTGRWQYRGLHGRRERAGSPAALEQQRHAPRRLAARGIDPRRDVRLRRGPLSRLRADRRGGRPAGAAPVRRDATVAEPGLRRVVGDAAARGRHARRVPALGEGRELLRVGVGRHRVCELRRACGGPPNGCGWTGGTSCSRTSAGRTSRTWPSGGSRA